MQDKIKSQLMQRQNWYRPITIVGVYIIASMVGGTLVALYLVALLAQWVLTIVLGEPNPTLKGWISKVNHYVQQLIEYVSAESDERPFPFSLLP